MSFLFFPTFANRSAGVTPVTFSFETQESYTPNATSHTFDDVDIGTAATGRVIVVSSTAQAADTIDYGSPAVVIGGVTATEIVKQRGTSPPNDGGMVGLHAAVLASGTTADITIKWNQSNSQFHIAVWNIIGGSGVSASDTGNTTTEGGGMSLTIPDGGCAVAATVIRLYPGSATCTWANVTENYDLQVEGKTFASGGSSTTAGSPSISGTWSSDPAYQATVCASWASAG